MADTADQKAAEKIASAIEGQVFRLNEERAGLVNAMARIREIDDELAILQAEKTRIEPRRPPRAPPIAEGQVTKVGSADVNSKRT